MLGLKLIHVSKRGHEFLKWLLLELDVLVPELQYVLSMKQDNLTMDERSDFVKGISARFLKIYAFSLHLKQSTVGNL